MCDATVHGRFTGFIGFVEAESESERRRRGDAADDGSCTHDPTMTRRPHRRRFTRAERTGFAAAARSHSEGSRMAARASEVNKFRRPSAAAVSPFRRPRHHYEMNPVMMLLFFLATIALGPVTAVSHSSKRVWLPGRSLVAPSQQQHFSVICAVSVLKCHRPYGVEIVSESVGTMCTKEKL
uniref:ShKT domain-containing protein n=1 Tax=Steinernema glaseri TaxID=37863 RepID=A0A1I7ZIV2_9BILA